MTAAELDQRRNESLYIFNITVKKGGGGRIYLIYK